MYCDCITVILRHNLLSIPRTNQYKYYDYVQELLFYYYLLETVILLLLKNYC